MLSRAINWLRKKAPFLFEDKMPVWLTILFTVSATVLTYFGAPSINRQFQLDDARSAQITKSVEGLNGEIISLSQQVRRLNSALVNESDKVPELRDDCLDSVTKIQWRIVDLRVVLTSREDRQALTDLAEALGELKLILDRSVDASSEQPLLEAMREVGERVQDVLRRLYTTAKLM
jgi:hypothetical protein